ncbi:hypothetical protein GS457_20590 [Rhodococcus hoagii]|nr:hypothetical protein [Prescottella equi]MBM4529520.1 hypothetical protein [Prescottella equi]MBM4547088.1 hypothetical protein [Prescottella equi]MBM4603381.1 hypothetical protein [Prescottella equi]MCA1008639.1 hypothetical protein [Prescottella equi]
MASDAIPEAEFGGRRRRPRDPSERVRVELRLPFSVAAELFTAANDRGQTVSRIGADAIAAFLKGDEE